MIRSRIGRLARPEVPTRRIEPLGVKIIKARYVDYFSRKQKSQFPDLRVQLDVFDDQRETDEELSNHGPPGIDLSSHVDVFYTILGQIADTPQEIPFLSILQHLLRLDPKEAASDLAWDTAETLVHRATLLESREDATKLLRSPSLQVASYYFSNFFNFLSVKKIRYEI